MYDTLGSQLTVFTITILSITATVSRDGVGRFCKYILIDVSCEMEGNVNTETITITNVLSFPS